MKSSMDYGYTDAPPAYDLHARDRETGRREWNHSSQSSSSSPSSSSYSYQQDDPAEAEYSYRNRHSPQQFQNANANQAPYSNYARQNQFEQQRYSPQPYQNAVSNRAPYSNNPTRYHQNEAQYSPLSPFSTRPSTSSLPIAIPATDSALGSPFLRAYPPSLAHYSITPSTFLSFIDALNRILVVSPPVRVLGLAGNIVGMVPLATAQIVGGAVNAAATVTSIAMSKGRSEMYLKEANKKIFAPVGLRAEMCKMEVVAKVAGMPVLGPDGKIRKGVALLGEGEERMGVQERRLEAMRGWTAGLEVMQNEHVSVPDGFLDRMHASASERQRAKEEGKLMEKREERREDREKLRKDYEKEMGKLDREEEKVRRKESKKPEKMASELRKVEKERSKVQHEYDKETDKMNGESNKKDKEEKAMRKIVWLLICPV